MFEKVNPSHPDKLADRVAGALVDLAYQRQDNPRIAVEVLLGHGKCHVIAETSVQLDRKEVADAVTRIAGNVSVDYVEVPQDEHLAENQSKEIHCGDNGIFKGCLVTEEQKRLSRVMRDMYGAIPYDGKAVIDDGRIIVCQSNATTEEVLPFIEGATDYLVNPLGPWTGGPDVDTGATNRKLGTDMGDAVTGGGLHGKDLSKADVSVNICCHLFAQEHRRLVTASCAIGDREVTFRIGGTKAVTMPYEDVVETADAYVRGLGGFERLAEWGLI